LKRTAIVCLLVRREARWWVRLAKAGDPRGAPRSLMPCLVSEVVPLSRERAWWRDAC
jgi:hypothetical protein